MTSEATSKLDALRRSAHSGASCRLCGSRVEASFVDLGKSPLCETFLDADQIDRMEPFYPLHALVCGSCFLVQLKEYVAADGIFTDHYPYYSSFSTSWVAHAKAYCEMIARRRGLDAKSLVIELACNDGYLLQHFPPLGVANILGVEPSANVAEVARQKGIPTVVDFFGVRLAREVLAQHGRADLIAGNNVLAHVPDLNDFVSGVALLLKPDGIATFEVPHLQNLIEQNQFDTIYHEHFCYFSAIAIDALAGRNGLRLVDVEELPTHGGSLRVYLAPESSSEPQAQAVRDLLAREERLGYRRIETYASYAEKVRATKRKLLSLLIGAKDAGKRICGYGAPGKGNTLLNYCGIGPDFIDFTVDRNPHKHGRFTPGTHIPILPVEAIDEAKPDYILILPWNLRREIMAQMTHVSAWGAKFIIPIPEARIVEPVRAES
jgi:2-polyprenyl-3-methyl-5-hydroxy-6-metoxy-1,4-benzoquinol methylase